MSDGQFSRGRAALAVVPTQKPAQGPTTWFCSNCGVQPDDGARRPDAPADHQGGLDRAAGQHHGPAVHGQPFSDHHLRYHRLRCHLLRDHSFRCQRLRDQHQASQPLGEPLGLVDPAESGRPLGRLALIRGPALTRGGMTATIFSVRRELNRGGR